MKVLLSIIISCTAMLSVGAQANLSMAVIPSNKTVEQQCVELTLTNNAIPLRLSSQNYRLYYSADNLSLDEASLVSKLPNDLYQLKLVQHVGGIDASGRGDLDFENNLGFINFSIVHTNIKVQGAELSSDNTSIVDMCFDVQDFDQDISIVLAREEVTSTYGRAYIELSTQDEKNTLASTSISEYKDLFIK